MNEKKSRILKPVIAGAVIAALLAIIFAASMFFRITDITYEGNTHYTDEEMTNYIFNGRYNVNALVYFLWGKRQEKAVIPFIQDYDVEVMWPDKLNVMIYEKEIIGYINYMGCNMYFDKDGIIVDSSQEVLEGIPEVMGINYRNIVLHDRLDTEDNKVFSIMLDLIQLFDKYEIEMDKVSFDNSLNVTVYIGNIRVILGSDDGITEKVHELNMMMPKLDGKSGVLYLNTFNEDTKSVIFKKDDDG